ncbi:MAG: hypothetical protein AAGI11_17540 [Pseudomonadota bacterium]
MKLNFLCNNHRQWLRENPNAAQSTWAKAFDRSQELAEGGHFLEAARQAGCALETADILIAQSRAVSRNDIHRFSESSAQLVQLLIDLREMQLAHTIIQGALHRLQALMSGGAHRADILTGCKRLMSIGEGRLQVGGSAGHTVH